MGPEAYRRRDPIRGLSAEEFLRWSRQMFEASPVGLAVTDEEGNLVAANAAYCALLGRDRAELIGRSPREFTHTEDVSKHTAMEGRLATAHAGGEQLRVEKRYQRPDGSVRWGWVSLAPAPGPHGETWTMLVVHDTTDRRRAEDELTDAATIDALTGLLNRRGWRDGLRHLTATPNQAEPLTLAMIDLDNFKHYNDTRGHAAGDALLQEFSARVRAELHTEDLIARWGGEEFALALPCCARGDAQRILCHLASLLPNGQTFSAGHTTHRVGESLATCWDRADTHLYRAKGDGKNRVATDPD